MDVARPWKARWITVPFDRCCSLPIFRKSIWIEQPPATAAVRLCGLGHFQLRCNGRKVGFDELEPGWTDYRKTCLFVVHDVSAYLHIGENTFDVLLGNGMYHVGGGRYCKFKGTFGPPKLIAEIELHAADGSSQWTGTDDSWLCAPGPITFSCIYGGEDFDARLSEPPQWVSAVGTDGPGGQLLLSPQPPVRVMQTLVPIGFTEPKPGVRVCDLGQNLSGRPRITVRAPAGTTFTIRPGELLGKDGCVTQKHTGSPVTFSFTTRGDAEETWNPLFSYTGFRYLQVEGPLDALVRCEAQFLHSSAEVIGQFECSNDLINRIHRLILAAIRSNMQSILTDCPHREKLGWLEQTHLMGPSIFYNFAALELYRKILGDIRDAQADDGCVPTIAPQYMRFLPPWDRFNDSPEWGSAIVLAPWVACQFTGDTTLVTENYPAMRRYVSYLESRADPNGIIRYGLSDWYDLGPQRPGFCQLTSPGVTATAIQYQNLRVLAWAAELLGRSADAREARQRAVRLRRAFNAAFYDANRGFYDTGSQTAQAMPLALGIVEEEHRDRVLQQLISDIRARANHISAGDIGSRFVFEALAQAGRSDVVFDLLSRTDPPSYGAQLAAGATTLTEAWDADPRSSQNHFMLGHAEEWLFRHLAGLQIDFCKAEGEQ
ncbi:MAG: family 78 glycoside hydrolase catalytic domain, partial [Phycisphaerae bacterium]|nr:family 78 glycoside hydrolase catalytic domain [Phycisphaerae bacterium]